VQPWWTYPFEELTQETSLLGNLDHLSAPVWTLALWTIVLGTIAPFALTIGALRHLAATRVGITMTFEPVAASIVAWAWLGETLSAVQILGGAVVLTGILLAQTAR
jgi:drug/metabolite transporter (DMT)-like permease